MDTYKQFAQIYDELINEDINYEKWSNIIIDEVDNNGIGKIDYLDLACGTGNLTIEIAEKFRNIWAVDLSEDMLMEAYDKLKSKGIKAKLVCQNICQLNLNKQFDLITCSLDSINYIINDNDIKNLFLNIANHLKPNGIFVFDINSYYKLTEILGNNTFNYDNDEVVYIWENNIENDILEMYLTFFVKNERDNIYKRFDEEHIERAYKEEYIEKLIMDSGLVILNKIDNYEPKCINEKTERIVYFVKKI
ncbi:MAG: class I SAM-dependent methyltransferase [Bacillota bacterium]|nr:class I SAM-dependent methyltransferase [Bacillota bacterium]